MDSSSLAQDVRNPKPSWRNMPGKGQLTILALVRICDFTQISSFQASCYFQLSSFQGQNSQETVTWQTGVALACFTGSQCFTAVLWGYATDASWCWRKKVLVLGLLGTGIAVLGVGFAHTFWEVVFCRLLAGAVNGTVGAV